MGESAGAMAVGNFINTYPDDPPFRAGVLQSGSSVVKIPPGALNNDTTLWINLTEQLNCTDKSDSGILDCVRAVPADTLRRIIDDSALAFGDPFMDNVTVLEYPATVWATGNVAKVPILIGSTKDDGSVFTLAAGDNVTAFIEASFGVGSTLSQMIEQLYPTDPTTTAGLTTSQQIIAQIATDVTFRCTSGFVANLTSTLVDVPVWQYVFDALVPSNTWEAYPQLGVYHASEIALTFGTYPRENSTETEARLSRSMQKQFADFVKDPVKGPGWSQWPDVAVLSVSEGDAVTTVEDVRELDAICIAWNGLYSAALASTSGTATSSSTHSNTIDSTTSSNSATATSSNTNNANRLLTSGSFMAGLVLLGLAALF